jgi:oligosaccharide repeat unit polymerase
MRMAGPVQVGVRSRPLARGQIRWRYSGLFLLAFAAVSIASPRIPGLFVLVVAGLLGLAISVANIRHSAGWLSPLGLPLLYITVVHTVPLAVAERWFFEGREPTLVNGLVGQFMATDDTTMALGLIILGFVSGVAMVWNGRLSSSQLRATLDQPMSFEIRSRLRKVGMATLGVSIFFQALYVQRNGFSRFAPTPFDKELTTMGRILMFAGVACIVIGAGQHARLGLRSLEVWLVGGAFVLAASWGSRAALLAPLLLLAFAITVRRPSSKLRVKVLAALGLAAFVLVAETRIRGAENLQEFGLLTAVERSIRDINAPTYLTYYTTQGVESAGLSWGTTYVAAFPYLVPSVVIDRLPVELPVLATTRYRELINFDRADRGFGFGVVAEAVMNFGPAGAMLAGFVFGLMCGLAYRSMLSGGSYGVTRRWVYPLLFASVPWIVRSDVLQGFKPMLYAGIAVAVCTFAVKRRSGQVAVRKRPIRAASGFAPSTN